MTFRKLLIANRGEIARRVIRSAHASGISTVAVFSDADADAPHVREADEAVRIGAAPVGESYLDAARLLDAAARTGAQAVHPGYGFLSENAEFAAACVQAGLTFVGPGAEAIALMGDKVQAKGRMRDAGVPVVPGYDGDDQSEARLLAEGETLGLPLLVKAVAGGGGRGMRRVTEAAALQDAIASARSEAASAFGRGDLFLERLVSGARHVEVQVLADTHGGIIHLGERECSVQRRHQKVIEEAPSPSVDEALRQRMGEAAVAAARAIDYVGAGTVEFLLDDEGQFYFLEMNTRLQVEHPVTEIVTGLDLVALQLSVARGEALPLTQADVALCGHAIEARLYAEDPYAGFVPCLGRVAVWQPASGPGVRVDDGIVGGQTITPFYDPMIAKVIAGGDTRAQATARLDRALRRSVLLGPGTNRAWLLALLHDEAFVAGRFKTDTIDTRGPDAFGSAPEPSPRAWAVAALARGATAGGQAWHSTGNARWPVTLQQGQTCRTVTLSADPAGGYGVEVEGLATSEDAAEGPAPLRIVAREGTAWRIDDQGVHATVHVAGGEGGEVHVEEEGVSFTFVEPGPAAAAESATASDEVRAPMGGRVVRVAFEAGAAVDEGATVAVVEAMKMEHRVTAPRAGILAAVGVMPGDQVTAGQVLASLEPDSNPDGNESESESDS